MTSVDCYTVHMTILVSMGGPTSARFRFRSGFTFERTFLDGGWIYIMGGIIVYLVFFVVHPLGV